MPNLVNVFLFLYQLNAILFLTGILCITIKSTARKFLIYALISSCRVGCHKGSSPNLHFVLSKICIISWHANCHKPI